MYFYAIKKELPQCCYFYCPYFRFHIEFIAWTNQISFYTSSATNWTGTDDSKTIPYMIQGIQVSMNTPVREKIGNLNGILFLLLFRKLFPLCSEQGQEMEKQEKGF